MNYQPGSRLGRAVRARVAKAKRRLIEPVKDAQVGRKASVFCLEVSRSRECADIPVVPTFWYNDEINVGDTLSRPILQGLLGLPVHRVGNGFDGTRLLAVGSILGQARRGDVVWGSGAISDRRIDGRGVTYLAVRGPLTRSVIDGDVPEVYGDPAVLLPRIYPQPTRRRRYDVGVVPHYLDRKIMRVDDPAVKFISVRTRNWQSFVDQIASCSIILSSSLHGIIVSEAYGIPAIWVKASGQLKGGTFKFDDYYAATGREGRPRPWSPRIRDVLGRSPIPEVPSFNVDHLEDALFGFVDKKC